MSDAMKRHDLKCWPAYYAAVRDGSKPFEVRKNDRDFKVGDILHLHEWDPETKESTGMELARRVTYILDGDNALCPMPGYVVMGLEKIDPPAVEAQPPAAQGEGVSTAQMRAMANRIYKDMSTSYFPAATIMDTLRSAADQIDAQASRIAALEGALRQIIDSVPACSDGGGMHFEHHDQDGNYIGSENVDPMHVIQSIVGIADKALSGAAQ